MGKICSIHQADSIIPNLYATNKVASKYRRQNVREQKGETDKPTILLPVIDSTLRKKIREIFLHPQEHHGDPAFFPMHLNR